MKKIVIIIMVLLLVLTLSACSESKGDIKDKTPANESTGNKEDNNSETIDTDDTNTENTNTDSSNVSLAEKLIYDENDVKVTVKGLNSEGFLGPEVKVLIENNSKQNITVQASNSSVNGMMVDTMFSADVARGKKSNDTITFSSSQLELSGITIIKDIEFSLHIIDTDTWDDIIVTDMITLATSADPGFVQSYDDSGYVAFDSDGIKVVVKKLNSSDSFWGSDVYLYIENNSKNNITVQAKDVSLNGFMVEPIFSSDIIAGKKAIDTMTFIESDLTDNGITDITDLEFKLHIFDMESWDTIKDSDAIKVTFE